MYVLLTLIYCVVQVKPKSTNRELKQRELPPDCDILSLCTPHAQVAQFVVSFCVKVLPFREVFGTRRNQSKFLSTLTAYVSLGKMCVHCVCFLLSVDCVCV